MEAIAFMGIVVLFGIVLYAMIGMSKPHTNKKHNIG